MTTETNHLPVVRDRLISVDPPALLGGRCHACLGLSFPVESYCPFCGTRDPEPVQLASAGTVYSFTIARFPPPGYIGEVPFGLGIVELPDGIRVASTLLAEPLDSLHIGATVRFRLLEIATEDGPMLSYAYAMENP